MLICKQISSNSIVNKITYKLFPYKLCMYNHLNVSKDMTDVEFTLLALQTYP